MAFHITAYYGPVIEHRCLTIIKIDNQITMQPKRVQFSLDPHGKKYYFILEVHAGGPLPAFS